MIWNIIRNQRNKGIVELENKKSSILFNGKVILEISSHLKEYIKKMLCMKETEELK